MERCIKILHRPRSILVGFTSQFRFECDFSDLKPSNSRHVWTVLRPLRWFSAEADPCFRSEYISNLFANVAKLLHLNSLYKIWRERRIAALREIVGRGQPTTARISLPGSRRARATDDCQEGISCGSAPPAFGHLPTAVGRLWVCFAAAAGPLVCSDAIYGVPTV